MSDSNGVHAVWAALDLVEHAFGAMGGGSRYPGFDDRHLLLGFAAVAAVVIYGPDLRGSSAGFASRRLGEVMHDADARRAALRRVGVRVNW